MSNSKLDDLLNNYDTQDEMNEAAKEELAELRASDKAHQEYAAHLERQRDALAAALRQIAEAVPTQGKKARVSALLGRIQVIARAALASLESAK